MSWPALGWAGQQKPGKASDKLVLIALADRHNEERGLAYPSIAWLCDFCDLNRKTVITSLQRLEALGLISDSGERVGETRQIKAYRLGFETVPKVEQSQKRNSSEKRPKQSQKRDTEPFRTKVSSNEETKTRGKIPKPDGVSEAVWRDYTGQRKKQITETALRGLKREADKAGWTLEAALEEATTRGWEGFKADWVKDRKNGRATTGTDEIANPYAREVARRQAERAGAEFG